MDSSDNKRLNFMVALAEEYGTDKLAHGYLPYYDKHLPIEPRSFLEIGVLKGASARMFDRLYSHKLDFHLVDLFDEPGNLTTREARRLEFIPHKGSQTDLTFLSTIPIKFDVVVEDASHNSWDQILTFKYGLLNLLNPRGLYIVEDLHCCKDPFYWNHESITSIENTLLHKLKNLPITPDRNFEPGECEILNSLIDTVHVYEDKIAFITIK